MVSTLSRIFSAWSIFVIFLAPSFVHGAVVADANADFTPNVSNPNMTNPNGVWTYGYTSTLGGAFTPFTEYFTHPSYFSWKADLGSCCPVFGEFTAATVNLDSGDAFLHGGPGGEYAVLRFTALVAGVYDVSAPWKPGDSGDTELFLLLNGNGGTPLASTPSTNTEGSLLVSNLNLSVNDTVDLALGTLGNFTSDATGANLVLSSVPEPGTAFLLLVATACCFVRQERRRTA